MADVDLVQLEGAIKRLPDVLGCVILTDPQGRAGEIQAFTRSGSDKNTVHQGILDTAAQVGVGDELRQVLVFELEAESIFGDRESLERAAELAEQEARARGIQWEPDPPLEHDPQTRDITGHAFRPPLRRVVLSSSAWKTHAEVVLGHDDGDEVRGESSGDKTPHGLKVLAQATLDAVANLVGVADFMLEGASLVSVVGQEAVLVMLRLHDGLEVLGAALVRDGPVSEAAVRATLDGLNRRFARLAE
ncbi:MAG TPA: hypothetical protein VEV43_01455 [Actinomycetota bacterium]|nr:hypothetical protein [Actinomycetota bacterium]